MGRRGWLALGSGLLAGLLYGASAAPGYTWAHFGADGGDFLAAAVTDGVPHPPGYPLYTLLLQGWLALLGWVRPDSTPAWRGNLLSVLCAALSVSLTAWLVPRLRLPLRTARSLGTVALVAVAWGVAPLLWDQATITEVYALHSLLVVGLVGLALGHRPVDPRRRAQLFGLVFGLGLAHHVTVVLLLPALAYGLWHVEPRARRPAFWGWVAAGTLPGLALYLRIPWAAQLQPPSPVNWGWPVTWEGFWWLVSGAAYRDYLFAFTSPWSLVRLSRWAQILIDQYAPVGLALVLAGLYRWDRDVPWLRNLVLLWTLPITVYMVSYNTVDSEVYLLPVVWWMALLLAEGLAEVRTWLAARVSRHVGSWSVWAGAALAALLLLTALRWPQHSLRGDREAEDFIVQVAAVLEPNSILFSQSDRETFALWYGAWAQGDLLEAAPGTVLLNVSLFQFPWYQELMATVYPQVPGIRSGSAGAVLSANAGQRPIYFAEPLDLVPGDRLEPVGPIWRYRPPP